MIVVLSGVNRDPTVFMNPDQFDPVRWMTMTGEGEGAGETFEQRFPLGARRWFGNGRRECVGRHWAWQFGFVVLAMLLREVDFEKAEADPPGSGYDDELRQDGWFNLRPVDFHVKVRPRAGWGLGN